MTPDPCHKAPETHYPKTYQRGNPVPCAGAFPSRNSNPGVYSGGFTLVELLVAMAITAILMAGVARILISQYRAYRLQELILESQQNTRAAMNTIYKEVRMAGYHAMDPGFVNNLHAWVHPSWIPDFPMAVNLDANPKITLGADGKPDMITFLSVLDSDNNPCTLKEATAPGDIGLILNLAPYKVKTEYLVDDLLHIGMSSEYARITGLDGSTLIIDTNPDLAGNQGLARGYAAGTEIGEISVVSYAVFNDLNDSGFKHHDRGHPVLRRSQNGRGFQPMAQDITGLSFTVSGSGVLGITLAGRTTKPVPGYSGNNGYPTYTMEKVIRTRNAVTLHAGTDCARCDRPGGFTLDQDPASLDLCVVKLKWDPVSRDEQGGSLSEPCKGIGYRVFYGDKPDLYSRTLDIDTALATVDVSDLKACTVYLAVSAVNGSGAGLKSLEISVSDTAAPDQPQVLSAVPGSESNQIIVTWDPLEGCDLEGYFLYRSTAALGPFTMPVTTRSIPARMACFSDKGLAGCKPYYYALGAVDRCGNPGPLSPVVSAEPEDTLAPVAPSDISVKRSSNKGDTVSWELSRDDPFMENGSGESRDVIAYRVYADGQPLSTVPAGTGSLDRAPSGFVVTYGVCAVDNCQNASLIVSEGDCVEFPQVSITAPQRLETCSGLLTVSGTVSPPRKQSVTRVELALGTTGWQPVSGLDAWTRVVDTTCYSDGLYDITVRAIDSSGCMGSATVPVRIDNASTRLSLECFVHSCLGSDGYIYMSALVGFTNGNPVRDVTVFADIPCQGFSDLGNGRYGGSYTPECMPQETGFTRSLATYTKKKDIPRNITLTVRAGQYTCETTATLDAGDDGS
ncbi:MAG: prepilin-type N-terminal cleavage/methylation domain-containing protein [Pseudomonadota bacterium]